MENQANRNVEIRDMNFRSVLLYGKLINRVIGIIDKNRGTAKSGEMALRICPDMIKRFKGIDSSKVLFITGTNGKSTTNNLINHILKENGYKVVSNIEGANLLSGVCTALIKASDLKGNVDADFFIFETDERYLQMIRDNLPCDNLLVTNIQKDQVQRNGDPDYIYRKISAVAEKYDMRLFLNYDEPRTNSLGGFSNNNVKYGVSRHNLSFNKDESYVSMACPTCRHGLRFEYYNNDGMGKYKCGNCGYANNGRADYFTDDIDFEKGLCSINGVAIPMPYDSPFMLYNYTAATAAAHELSGISIEKCGHALKSFKNISGRFEILHYKGKTIKYMRIKQENPETLQNCINIMADDPENKMVALGLAPLVDFVPHYAITFYAYDCDFSKLIKSNVEKFFCFTEAVCYDTANRLVYEGEDPNKISVAETEDAKELLKEIENTETDNIYLITWLHAYEHLEKYLKKEGAELE